jgi:hypothetical protein
MITQEVYFKLRQSRISNNAQRHPSGKQGGDFFNSPTSCVYDCRLAGARSIHETEADRDMTANGQF